MLCKVNHAHTHILYRIIFCTNSLNMTKATSKRINWNKKKMATK